MSQKVFRNYLFMRRINIWQDYIKIIIIIPAYNESAIIAQLVQHLLRHSDEYIREIIAAGVGNTDDTLEKATHAGSGFTQRIILWYDCIKTEQHKLECLKPVKISCGAGNKDHSFNSVKRLSVCLRESF